MNQKLKEYKKLLGHELNMQFCNACLNGNLEFVRTILNDKVLKERINLDFKSNTFSNGDTFNNACYSGNLELVKFLINYELSLPEPQIKTKLNNALITLGEFEHLHIIKYILESPSLSKYIQASYDDYEFINSVCDNDTALVLDYLLNNKNCLVKYNVSKINDGIFYACSNNNYEIIKCILDKSKNKDKTFETIYESYSNNKSILEFVICNYGITKTPFIQNLIKHDENVMKMFYKQDLNTSLQNMPTKENKKRKTKI